MSIHSLRGISVVVPVYNEQESVRELYEELVHVLDTVNEPFEIIIVDDGSTDATSQNLKEITAEDDRVITIQFRRNFGQTAALAAGFQMTNYPTVIAIDGDLQNDPCEIPRMVAKLREGYDLVAGWRKDRHDAFLSRKLPSMIANKVISLCTRVKLHDYGCTLKAMTSEVAKGIRLYGEMHRFIPALADEIGARITEIPVNHRARKFGRSKYGISRTIRVILDLVTVKFLLGYSKRPIHLFGSIGFLLSSLGFIVLSIITFQRLFLNVPMGSRPLLALSVMCILLGLQFLVFGLLAEVLARTYYESQNKAIYVVRNVFRSGKAESIKLAPNKVDSATLEQIAS
jgi:glycosyltransferase involved in cell wall biosynthesis